MKHGTEAGYRNHKCRCELCVKAAKRNEWLRHSGKAGLVPADRVYALYARLKADGWSDHSIGRATGSNPRWVRRITDRSIKRIRRSTEQRILTADLTPPAHQRCDGNGTALRIQALACMGWRVVDLAPLIGSHKTSLTYIARGGGTTVGIREAVRRAYDDLAGTPGPSNRARARARNRGWLPPLALDDDRLDDPTYVPEPLPADPGRGGVHAEDVRWLLAQGESREAVATRLGISVHHVHTLARRTG